MSRHSGLSGPLARAVDSLAWTLMFILEHTIIQSLVGEEAPWQSDDAQPAAGPTLEAAVMQLRAIRRELRSVPLPRGDRRRLDKQIRLAHAATEGGRPAAACVHLRAVASAVDAMAGARPTDPALVRLRGNLAGIQMLLRCPEGESPGTPSPGRPQPSHRP
jgi:hypothetical protein